MAWCGAAEVHLKKLDRVQARAQKIGRFEVHSLQVRREAAVLTFALKLLDGDARGVLKHHIPTLYEPMALSKKRTRQVLQGKQIKSVVNAKSLYISRRGFYGILPKVWSKLPSDLIMDGYNRGWKKIIKRSKKYLFNECKESVGKRVKLC